MNTRIKAEHELLRLHFTHADYVESGGLHWFLVGPLRTPENWSPDTVLAAFSVTQGHPGPAPYGFYVPAELTFNGGAPAEQGAPHQPPFPGRWRFLSWNATNWQAAADVSTGSNLWGWVRSFIHRLREGK